MKPIAGSPYELPPGLPVPVDDGACSHLPGRAMPSVRLESIRGRKVDVGRLSRQPTIMFFYPAATGTPSQPSEWDLIPGARGCTAQNCAYRDSYQEFRGLGVEVYGISAQEPAEQKAFADRVQIPYELLSDAGFELAEALHLPTFDFRGKRYIKRLTLVTRDGRIGKVFYPVFPPNRNAEVVLNHLRVR